MTPPNRPRPPGSPAPRPAPRPGARIQRMRAAQPRQMHFVMRDGTAIDGVVQVGDDQTLVSYLNSRSGWVNVTQARRAHADETPGHMVVQTDHIMMAMSPDGAVQVAPTAASGGSERLVELVMVGGRVVRGYVSVAPGQRLSDCVASAGKFIGVTLARLFPEAVDVGDVALKTDTVEIVRDLSGNRQEAAE